MRVPYIRPARLAAPLLAAGVLAACNTSGVGPIPDAAETATVKQQYQLEDFVRSTYCPPVQIRAQTEALTTYERGHDNESEFVRTQASIRQTARECHRAGNTLTIKLGVSGRVVAGPKGGPGTVTLPVRVAVVKQTGGAGPMFSQLYKIPVTLTAPDLSTGFEQVFDQIAVEAGPEDRNLLVFVGFDEGK